MRLHQATFLIEKHFLKKSQTLQRWLLPSTFYVHYTTDLEPPIATCSRMTHQVERAPLQRFVNNIKAGLLVACLMAVLVSAKPLTSSNEGKNPDTLLQLSSNNALAPKSTKNLEREIESAAAPGPLSPEHKRARELWNKVKKPRRYLRDVPRNECEANSAVTNRNVSKYILELYHNLTEQREPESQANTVRSLQTVNDGESVCMQYSCIAWSSISLSARLASS